MRLRIIILSYLLLVAVGCSTEDPTRHNTFLPLTSIEVIGTDESLAEKTVKQYTAIGDFSGAFTRDITTEVAWTIENNAIASVSNDTGSEGLVTALSPGETSITAMYGDFSGSWPVIVTNALLAGIEITPQNAELQVGITRQYEAIGTFSDDSIQDITTLATWESSDTDVATIDNAGLATTLDAGTIIISGTWQDIEASTSLIVTGATLTSITLTPAEATVAQGTIVQFEAEGTFSDDTTLDITDIVDWQTSVTDIGDVNTEGLATGVTPGETEISASFDVDGNTISSTALLTVSDAFLESISVTPENSTIQVDENQQFAAIGTFSDGSEQDITELATWLSTPNTVGVFHTFSRGIFISTGPGTTLIEAFFNGIDGETLLTVQ